MDKDPSAAFTGACGDSMSRHALSVSPTLKAKGGLDNEIITAVTAAIEAVDAAVMF